MRALGLIGTSVWVCLLLQQCAAAWALQTLRRFDCLHIVNVLLLTLGGAAGLLCIRGRLNTYDTSQ